MGQHEAFEGFVISTGRFVDDAGYRFIADPTKDGGETLPVVADAQSFAVRQTVKVNMIFRDVGADGNVSDLFSSPMLVIRSQTPGIRSGRLEKMGAIRL
jgi:hypothetical protein